MAGSRSLTLAVRDQLRAAAPPAGTVSYAGYGLGLANENCDVTFDGRPNPNCGKIFVAVHHGRRNNQLLTGDESMFGVDVTISARANEPFDRIGPNLVDWAYGVMAWGDKVWAVIFGNQWGNSPLGIMNRANQYLIPASGDSIPDDAYGWTEALYPTGMSQAEAVRADWFSATEDQQMQGQNRSYRGNTMPFVGLKVVVTCTGAKRIQRLDDIGA